jgi:hypothetical protein
MNSFQRVILFLLILANSAVCFAKEVTCLKFVDELNSKIEESNHKLEDREATAKEIIDKTPFFPVATAAGRYVNSLGILGGGLRLILIPPSLITDIIISPVVIPIGATMLTSAAIIAPHHDPEPLVNSRKFTKDKSIAHEWVGNKFLEGNAEFKEDVLSKIIRFGLNEGYLCNKKGLFSREKINEILKQDEIYHAFLVFMVDSLSEEQSKVLREEYHDKITPEEEKNLPNFPSDSKFDFARLPDDVQEKIFFHLNIQEQINLLESSKVSSSNYFKWRQNKYIRFVNENKTDRMESFGRLTDKEKEFYVKASNNLGSSNSNSNSNSDSNQEERTFILYDMIQFGKEPLVSAILDIYQYLNVSK